MAIKRIGVLTSGGDAPGMNAALRAAVRAALNRGDGRENEAVEVIGIRDGYLGLVENQAEIQDGEDLASIDSQLRRAYLFRMTTGSVSGIIQRGGTILRSARLDSFKGHREVRDKAYATLQRANIDALLVLGGDGSFRGALDIHKEMGIPVAGVPCTIDNDTPYSDASIGFDTAVNTVVGAISNLRDTMGSHGRVTVLEVMGRGCGDIATYAGLAAGADAILVPEMGDPAVHKDEWIDYIIGKLTATRTRGKVFGVIVMAEGVRREKKKGAAQTAELVRKALETYEQCGRAKSIELIVREAIEEERRNDFTPESVAVELERRTGVEARSMTLGHIQRGGSPTAADRVLASRLAAHAVDLLISGEKNSAVGVRNGALIHMPIADALKMVRESHTELIRLENILAM